MFFRSEIWSGSSNYIMEKKNLVEKVNSEKEIWDHPTLVESYREAQLHDQS